jgi:C-terminal processing protease CtpA/Prc
MKLLLLLLFAPAIMFAQTIPHKANTIIVHNVSFEQCVNTLLDMGYEIAKMDKDYQTLRTEYKKSDVKKIQGWRIAIAVRVKDSVATITSYTYDKSGALFDNDKQKEIDDFQIEYLKSSMYISKELFSVMDAYAKKLNPVVEYAKN